MHRALSRTRSQPSGTSFASLLHDPSITEVMVNGPGEVWVERDATLQRSGVWLDESQVAAQVEALLMTSGRRVDRTSPVVDARLADGSRVNIVLSPVAVDGTCITIRRFAVAGRTLEDFASPAQKTLLENAMAARANIVVSGATGAGKTSLLNALAACIETSERIVTIEDAAELRLPGAHVLRLETRQPNAEGTGAVTVDDLVRNALRMRPDRIVVGECRGVEAFDMVQALHTGHRGSLTTVHANDAADALSRLETMMVSARPSLPLSVIRRQLCSAIDVVVHVQKTTAGERRIAEIFPTADAGRVLDGAALVGRRTEAIAFGVAS